MYLADWGDLYFTILPFQTVSISVLRAPDRHRQRRDLAAVPLPHRSEDERNEK
jgi:hypothetical protein